MSNEIREIREMPEKVTLEREYRAAVENAHAKIAEIDNAASHDPTYPYKKGKEEYYRLSQGRFQAFVRLLEDVLRNHDPHLVNAVKHGLMKKLMTMGHKPARDRIEIIEEMAKIERAPSILELVELTTASALEDRNSGALDSAKEHPDGVLEVEEELLEVIVGELDKELADILPERIVEVDGFPQRTKQTNYISDIIQRINEDIPKDEEAEKVREQIWTEYNEFQERRQ